MFVHAGQGTVFLDEIGELPLATQAKLLRAIEMKEILPVSTHEPIRVEARIVAATNRNLAKEVEAGPIPRRFVLSPQCGRIELPPLRDRREDIPDLVEYLLARHARTLAKPIRGVSHEAMQFLLACPWKGNVRELDNALQRAVILGDGPLLEPADCRPSRAAGAIRTWSMTWARRSSVSRSSTSNGCCAAFPTRRKRPGGWAWASVRCIGALRSWAYSFSCPSSAWARAPGSSASRGLSQEYNCVKQSFTMRYPSRAWARGKSSADADIGARQINRVWLERRPRMAHSRYRIYETEFPYFMTCTIVGWLPVFARPEAATIILDSWKFLQKERSLQIFGYVIMENHLHLIGWRPDLAKAMKDFKSFTARKFVDFLELCDSGLLEQLRHLKERHKMQSDFQVWQEGNHPQQIAHDAVMSQKMEYMHNNPIRRGYVDEPVHWRYSRLGIYAGMKGLIDVVTNW